MADLRETQFLFFDAQTTGMRPPAGRLIEFGYALGSALSAQMSTVHAQKFALVESSVPRKVREITGLSDPDFANMPAERDWCAREFRPWLDAHPAPAAIIHYAQFEIPFLKHLLGVDELPFGVLCAHQITRRLFPTLPSQNIRAVAGFFGHPMLGPNRAGEFVRATKIIWNGLCEELAVKGVADLPALQAMLSAKPAAQKKREISYRIPAELRLKLPDRPGIYRMLAKTGEVLYVGKATSLKDRVNSYFRGVKNRDKRKLEMLAQTWDMQVEECGSPLEAALRETDEIKRLNPRYNVSLKKGSRQLCFYSEDFGSCSMRQDEFHPRGPFRPGGFIDMVLTLQRSLHAEEFEQIFYEPIDPMVMKAGFALFLKLHGLEAEQLSSMRSLLAYGLHLHRHYVEPEEAAEDADVVTDEALVDADQEAEVILTAEDLAGKFERLLRRAGGEMVRSQKLTQILNSDIEFLNGEEWRKLSFRTSASDLIWADLDIEAYDRASILLSELSRLTHRLVRQSLG